MARDDAGLALSRDGRLGRTTGPHKRFLQPVEEVVQMGAVLRRQGASLCLALPDRVDEH